jgi:hypothetical protein
MFQGETLCGLLLNAFAFGTVAAIGAYVSAAVMLIRW